jgi:hypothetical protein
MVQSRALAATTAPSTGSAPSQTTLQALAGAFIAIQSANKAIELQALLPVVADIPGLSGVNASLATAQANAASWTKISANVQNQLQAVIDYNALYVPLSASINSAISAIKQATVANPPSASTMSNLAAELSALQSQVQTNLYGNGGTKASPQVASALGVYNQLTSYQSLVAADSSAFSGYSTLAFNSKDGISEQIKQYNSDIDADNTAMAKDRAMVAGGAAMIVTGVLICVVAVALAPETGGVTIAAIGTLGVATVAGGAVMIGVASSDLNTKESDVANKLIAIANDNLELVNLTTLNTACSNVATHAGDIYGALDTIQTSWAQMDNDMSSVVNALNLPQTELMSWIQQQAGGTSPSYFIMGTILEAQFAAPQADWQTAATTAQTILNALANVVDFTLPTGTVPTQSAIAAHSVKQAQA